MLGDQHLGRERAQQRRDDRVEGPQPAGVGGAGRQRDVDRRALGARPAGSRGSRCPGTASARSRAARSSAPAGRRRRPPRRRRRGARRRRRRRPARRPGRAASGCRRRGRCRRRSRWPGRASRGAGRRRCWRCAGLARSRPGGPPRRWRRRRARPPRASRRTPGCRRCRGRVVDSRCRGPCPPADRLDEPGVVHGRDQVVVGDRRRHHRAAGSRTPSSRASRIVRSTRTGDIGCAGPKS